MELFTSEGCSSCPPADRLLMRLAEEQPVEGALVVPVSLHVDYWNRLGWSDPYSSAGYTARQEEYARRFGVRGVYTPQMVVNGRAELVGSDDVAARRAIAEAARGAGAVVRVTAGEAPGTLRVGVAGARTAAPADVLLVVIENGLASTVTRGENAGKRLAHAAVARELRVLGNVDASGRFTATAPVGRAGGALRAFAFVQERDSRRVLGVSPPVALR